MEVFTMAKVYKVYLSAGHGYYFDSILNNWVTQRRAYWGVTEDFWNVLVARELHNLLKNDQRFKVFPNRDFFNEQRGESGYPKWQEASHLYFKALGAPESVWNFGSGKAQAINADALGAEYLNTDIAVSLHANAGGGSARGYEVWHHTEANYGRKLASKIEQALSGLPTISRGLKADKEHDRYAFWVSTQKQIMSLVEYFFFDNEEDNTLMQREEVIKLCAQLAYQGIVDFTEIHGKELTWIS